jgi:hypothetical protein
MTDGTPFLLAIAGVCTGVLNVGDEVGGWPWTAVTFILAISSIFLTLLTRWADR